MVPAKVVGVFWEGNVGFPGGMVGATTVTGTPRSWGWRRPDSSSIVGLLRQRGKSDMRGHCLETKDAPPTHPAFSVIDKYLVCVVDLARRE
jgi:hypothetical protein